MAERLERAGVAQPDIGKVVKSKFVSLVEGHYLQRVKPPNPEVILASHGDQEMGGVVMIPAFSRFDLPPALNGMNLRGIYMYIADCIISS